MLKAGNEINNLIYSTDTNQRELALSIISELKHLKFTNEIETLINDPELSVKKNAILVACKLNISRLLPYIIDLLGTPSNRFLVLQGLQQYGDNLFNDIKNVPVGQIHSNLSDFIKMAGKINGPNSTNFLLTNLDDPAIRTEKIIHALWFKQYEASTGKFTSKLNEILANCLKTAKRKLNTYYEVPNCKEEEMLKNSFYNEVLNDLITSLKICFILHKRNEINRLIELLEIEKRDKIFNAMEMLEMVLPKKIAKDINYLVDFILDPEGAITFFKKPDLANFFTRIILNDSEIFNSWTKAVCLYSSWQNNQTGFLKKLSKSEPETEDLIVTETKNFVLSGLKSIS